MKVFTHTNKVSSAYRVRMSPRPKGAYQAGTWIKSVKTSEVSMTKELKGTEEGLCTLRIASKHSKYNRKV